MTALLHTHIPVLPSRRRQGPRHLRPGRPPGPRGHRSHQRLRLGPADRHPGQGPHPDRADVLLAGFPRTCPITCSAPIWPTWGRTSPAPEPELRGPVLPGAQDAGGADRVRGARLPGRFGLEGVSADGRVCGLRSAGGLARRPTSFPNRSSLPRPRRRAATM